MAWPPVLGNIIMSKLENTIFTYTQMVKYSQMCSNLDKYSMKNYVQKSCTQKTYNANNLVHIWCRDKHFKNQLKQMQFLLFLFRLHVLLVWWQLSAICWLYRFLRYSIQYDIQYINNVFTKSINPTFQIKKEKRKHVLK